MIQGLKQNLYRLALASSLKGLLGLIQPKAIVDQFLGASLPDKTQFIDLKNWRRTKASSLNKVRPLRKIYT